jgi:hypothetical protein
LLNYKVFFAFLTVANEMVSVGPQTTAGQIFYSMLSANGNSDKTLEQILDSSDLPQVRAEYRKKYQEKLAKAASQYLFMLMQGKDLRTWRNY